MSKKNYEDLLNVIMIGLFFVVIVTLFSLLLYLFISIVSDMKNDLNEQNKKNKRKEKVKIQNLKKSIKTTSIFKLRKNRIRIAGKLKGTSISMLVEYHSYEEVLEIYGLNLKTENNKGDE